MLNITHNQALQLMRLRVFIASAGQNDSLRWWEDESLTANGSYLLERIFPGSPTLSGIKLALIAASVRHKAAVGHIDNAVHLFQIRTDNSDQLALRGLNDIEMSSIIAPIDSIGSLRVTLLDMFEAQPQYEVIDVPSHYRGLRIRLKEQGSDIINQAMALAWAYTEGDVGNPVFPYIVEQQ